MMAAPGAIDDAPTWPDDAIEVGRIVDAWGIKGWIKVQTFASQPQALLSSRRWFLKPPEAQGPKRPVAVAMPSLLRIAQAKTHGDVVVAQVKDVDDRSGAEALRGARVFVSRGSFPSVEPDEYYWVDLIGLRVVNLQGESLGTVSGLLETGPHSVLRITPDGASADDSDSERLVPFVAAYVTDVSLAERRITVDWGLDY